MFQRCVKPAVIKSLLASDLFNEKLKIDIQNGDVFPTIRKDYFDFYYQGGSLFKFEREFSTHKKYASVIKSADDYILEPDLRTEIQLISDFTEGYARIKENCKRYQGNERRGVANVYHNYSFVKNNAEISVLDIEVSFTGGAEYIDILLYNRTTRQLRFYEAKHYSNSDLWSAKGSQPNVIHQVGRYEAQIENEASNILEQYCHYVDIMNEVFECNLPEPTGLDEKVVLLVFGFDRDQQQGRLKSLLVEDGSLQNTRHYLKGDIASVVIQNMWNAIK